METKNDIAWNKLFEKHRILEGISRNGIFEINSSQINELREARLMTKFDYRLQLPKIFAENKLSILLNFSQKSIYNFSLGKLGFKPN